MEHNLEYNTQLEQMVTGDYGRIIQSMIESIKLEKDRILRNEYAYALVEVMQTLNPGVKNLENYEQELWQQMMHISNYELDVDCPYELTPPDEKAKKPEPIPYKDELIKFRFYGRNLQQMVEEAAVIEDKEIQKAFVNYIASFMVNSSRNWNDESLDKETVVEHFKVLSKGELVPNPDDLEIHIEHGKPRKNNKPNRNQKSKKQRRKKR
jgi:hypothetical protein